MSAALINVRKGMAAINRPLHSLAPALEVAVTCRGDMNSSRLPYIGGHHARWVERATQVRNRMLPNAERALAAANDLFPIVAFPRAEDDIDAPTALAMLSVLFGTLSKKKAEDESAQTLLMSCAEMFDPISNRIGESTKLWKSVSRHPVIVGLAIKHLIATKIFAPAPSEVREACELVKRKLAVDYAYVEQWLEKLSDADAVLLHFAYEEWQRPYLTEVYSPLLSRILHLHSVSNIGEEGLGEDEVNPFLQLVEREQAKLAIVDESQSTKLAALRKNISVKRSKPENV